MLAQVIPNTATLSLSINAAGDRIAFSSTEDLTGENSNGISQVFLFDMKSNSLVQVTPASPQGAPVPFLSIFPAIIGDGSRIVFLSRADLTGGNADGNVEIFLANCDQIVNDMVELTPLSSTFLTTSDVSACPAGFSAIFHFSATLSSNDGGSPLEDLRLQVTSITNDNLVQNADGEPGGEGAVVTVVRAGAFADGRLDPGEAIELPMAVCLRDLNPFQFFVNVIGKVAASP
jgi:hypothetical protein